MDHYADDLAEVTAHLDLQDTIHIGHSTGGGEVVHYIAQPWRKPGLGKAAIISAVPPLMVQTPANPKGLPKKVFDDFQVAARSEPLPVLSRRRRRPLLQLQQDGRKPSETTIENWWRQGMMGGAKAHYDGIVAFSQTDFTEDLKKINVPVLVMHAWTIRSFPMWPPGRFRLNS